MFSPYKLLRVKSKNYYKGINDSNDFSDVP